jgi:purine-binding chemotaxis protein CheW
MPEPDVGNGSQAVKLFCLEMAGLKLAIPENQFGGIIDFPGTGQLSKTESRYLLGIFTHDGTQTKIINTPLLIIPQKYQQFYGNDAAGRDHASRLKKVLLLDDGAWGLACDAAGEAITVPDDDIHWRTAKAKRIWLAGTAIKQKCAILAVDGLLNSVEKQD